MKKILLVSALVLSFFSYSFQFDKIFPVKGDKFDDSVLTNQMYEFKGFKDQGYILLDYKDLKNVDLYINGNKVKTDNLKNSGNVKIDISKFTNNEKNIIQVSNLDGEVNVKIPYPKVIENKKEGYNKEVIKFVDEFIQAEVKAGMPSAQIAVIKDGKLELSKSYGYVNNYDKNGEVLKDRIKVTEDTIYDLASNTKMYATNYAIMKLVSEGKLKIDQYLYEIYPEFNNGEKAKIQLSDVLKHQAGFPADPQYFNDKYDKDDGIKNGKNDLYAIGKKDVLEAIFKTPLEYSPKTKTKYSDVDYMLLGLIVEKVSGKDLDTYVKEEFYDKLGLTHTMFNPLEHGVTKDKVAATELNGNTRDGAIEFINARHDTVWGQVHDEKAFYSMKGVSGHAGLFSNARELAKLGQVMVNLGGYDDNKFFDRTTFDHFIKPKDINSSFGLGWRRQGDFIYKWAFSGLSEKDTIGHTGWTGTLTIVSPKENLVVVLLTNAKNSPVINNKENPNGFYGNHYYTTNYGAISSLLIDAFSNKANKGDYQRMNSLLKDMITQKYDLIISKKFYDNSADKRDVIELINLLQNRSKGKLDKKFIDIRNELK